MLYLQCPYCGERRDEQEFHYAGEAYIARPTDLDTISDEAWGDYVFMRSNRKGPIWEQWEHTAGCRKVFVVNRNNVTNEVIGTYTLAEGKAYFLEQTHAAEESL